MEVIPLVSRRARDGKEWNGVSTRDFGDKGRASKSRLAIAFAIVGGRNRIHSSGWFSLRDARCRSQSTAQGNCDDGDVLALDGPTSPVNIRGLSRAMQRFSAIASR